MKKLLASLLAAGVAWAFSVWLHERVSGGPHDEAVYEYINGTPDARAKDEFSSTSSISYLGQYLDASVAPASTPSVVTTQGPACKLARSGAKTNGYDPVDTDLPRGNAGYCAWPSWGSCGGKPLEFGVFFNLNGDPGLQSRLSGHPQLLAGLADVTGHELPGTCAGPHGNGRGDAAGQKKGDERRWGFGESKGI